MKRQGPFGESRCSSPSSPRCWRGRSVATADSTQLARSATRRGDLLRIALGRRRPTPRFPERQNWASLAEAGFEVEPPGYTINLSRILEHLPMRAEAIGGVAYKLFSRPVSYPHFTDSTMLFVSALGATGVSALARLAGTVKAMASVATPSARANG